MQGDKIFSEHTAMVAISSLALTSLQRLANVSEK
uniref:Uncharacterized protein n=1 Tax=Anguilla anguilla TaxID=7936 RepID=A0A0E9SLE0_ANGAN